MFELHDLYFVANYSEWIYNNIENLVGLLKIFTWQIFHNNSDWKLNLRDGVIIDWLNTEIIISMNLKRLIKIKYCRSEYKSSSPPYYYLNVKLIIVDLPRPTISGNFQASTKPRRETTLLININTTRLTPPKISVQNRFKL